MGKKCEEKGKNFNSIINLTHFLFLTKCPGIMNVLKTVERSDLSVFGNNSIIANGIEAWADGITAMPRSNYCDAFYNCNNSLSEVVDLVKYQIFSDFEKWKQHIECFPVTVYNSVNKRHFCIKS